MNVIYQRTSTASWQYISAIGVRESTARRSVCVVADVRTVYVSLCNQCHALPVRQPALLSHLRIMEVQQQPALHQLFSVDGVQASLPGKRTVGAVR